jgi:hypothetical protein
MKAWKGDEGKKKELSIVTLCSTYAVALTFQNLFFRSGTSGASVQATGCSSTRRASPSTSNSTLNLTLN